MCRTPKPRINNLIIPIIERALKSIKIPSLFAAARLSLVSFYNKQYAEISRITPSKLAVIFVLTDLLNKSITPQNGRVMALRSQGIYIEDNQVFVPTQNAYGVPLKKFSQDYFRENVTPILDNLCSIQAKDPNDVSGRNSLRNLAEMEVRYNDHLQQIEELRAAGHKLVIASVHADCSDRCRPWQGKVYSLDGTYGTTDDGRKYEPIENATDIFYTTKAGKTYKNGLLGFNCRHFLIPYKSGYRFPQPNVEEERKQYAITLKQRQLEREVRKWRTEALTSKGLDGERYSLARKKAIEWNKEYIRYSRENGRAYYPSRTKII